jgi:carbon monoxide dehydrogenase subunit G
MIQDEQSITIDTSLENVWNYVQDIEGWASIFPGYQSCVLKNENDSEWTIKVSAAGVTRTDTVQVHVEKWNGPGSVEFVFAVDDLPVDGSGTYLAKSIGDNQTEISLQVCIVGSGPMAPMWEAVGTPLLPEFVKNFAMRLKAEIENVSGVGTTTAQDVGFAMPVFTGMVKSSFIALFQWLKNLVGLNSKQESK